jgi:predicted ATPase
MRAYRVGIAGPVGSGKTALVDCAFAWSIAGIFLENGRSTRCHIGAGFRKTTLRWH